MPWSPPASDKVTPWSPPASDKTTVAPATQASGAGWNWHDLIHTVGHGAEDLAKSAAVPFLNIASLVPGAGGATARKDAQDLQRGVSPFMQIAGGILGSIPLGVAGGAGALAAGIPEAAAMVATGAAVGAGTSAPGERGVGAVVGGLGGAVPGAVKVAKYGAKRALDYGLTKLGASAGPGLGVLKNATSEIAPHIPGQVPVDIQGAPAPTPGILAKQAQVPNVQKNPLVPALGPKPEPAMPPAEADIMKGLPGVNNGVPLAPAGINAGLEKSFQATSGALETQRLAAGKELGALGVKYDKAAQAPRENEASLRDTIKKLQAEYDSKYKLRIRLNPAFAETAGPAQVRQRIAAFKNELALAQKAPDTANALHETLTSLGHHVNDMAKHDIGPAQSELRQISSQIADIQKNPKTQLERLIKLRRYISERAGYTDPATGAKAISEHNAKVLSSDINAAIDKHIPEYAGLRAKYGEILGQQEPFQSRLLRAMNEPEGSADYTGAILRDGSLKNLELAKKAAGGVAPIDTAMSQRVINDLHGKNLEQTAEYMRKNQRVLDELPQAKAAVGELFSRRSTADMQVAMQKSLIDKYNVKLDSQQKALQLRSAQLKAQGKAQDEVNKLYQEQQDIASQRTNAAILANKRAKALSDQYVSLMKDTGTNLTSGNVKGFLISARRAGLVDDADYERLLGNIDRARGMISKASEKQRILKSALWGISGSFGAYLLGREIFSYYTDENSRH